MNKTQILVLSLILVLIINTVVHFTHPAYKFYNDNVNLFRKDYQIFCEQVKKEFVPAVMQIASNRLPRVSNTIKEKEDSVIKNEMHTKCEIINTTKKELILPINYWSFNNTPYIDYKGFYFKVGDKFFGSCITSIDSTLVETETHCFPLTYKEELSKNDKRSTF